MKTERRSLESTTVRSSRPHGAKLTSSSPNSSPLTSPHSSITCSSNPPLLSRFFPLVPAPPCAVAVADIGSGTFRLPTDFGVGGTTDPAGADCLRRFFFGASPSSPCRGCRSFAGELLAVTAEDEGRGGSGKPALVIKAIPRRWSGSAESNLAGRKTMGSLPGEVR